MFYIEIANIPIGIENRYNEVYEISKDYLTKKPPSFTVFADDDDLAFEAAKTDEVSRKEGLESIALYRKIADSIWKYDAFVFHGAVVNYEGKAYLFTAKSGVGKTTHIRLWLRAFGEKAKILNGDKPVIRVIDGQVFISGTPWRGKEQYGEPGLLPLAGIAFLERSSENCAYPETPDNAIKRFATQAYIPKTEPLSGTRMLRLFNKVLTEVPLITLKCNMDIDAAKVAKEAFDLSAAQKAGEI